MGGEAQGTDLELLALAVDGELELLGEVDEALRVRGGVRVERAAVEEAAHARNDGGGDHRGDEVAVGPELGLVFVLVLVLVFIPVGAA